MNIVTFDQAVKLKELGFNLPTIGFYPPHCRSVVRDSISSTTMAPGMYPAPSVSDALQWFRDEKGILCTVDMEYYDGIHYFGKFMDIGLKDGGETEEFNNFPEAESALLDALLKYLEVKQ